jgi:hypothetical protein
MGHECEYHLDPGVNLCIVQLSREGTVRATGPQVHPHYHRPPPEWLNAMADYGPQEVCTHRPSLKQPPNNVAEPHVPLAVLRVGTVTHECRKWHVGIIP